MEHQLLCWDDVLREALCCWCPCMPPIFDNSMLHFYLVVILLTTTLLALSLSHTTSNVCSSQHDLGSPLLPSGCCIARTESPCLILKGMYSGLGLLILATHWLENRIQGTDCWSHAQTTTCRLYILQTIHQLDLTRVPESMTWAFRLCPQAVLLPVPRVFAHP